LANTRVSDGVSNADFAKEREALYKLLFDMRAEINALKNAVATGEGLYEGIQREYPKIGNELSTNERPEFGREGQITFVDNEQYEDFNEDENTIEIENLSLVDKEIELIKKALDKSGGKRKVAAKELGISERTLYRKIKQYNLE
jgi:DNA-binding NtrC family response regulator